MSDEPQNRQDQDGSEQASSGQQQARKPVPWQQQPGGSSSGAASGKGEQVFFQAPGHPETAAPPAARAARPTWRAWQLSGLTLAALALGGYAVLVSPGGEARRVLGAAPGEPPQFTLLLAGRDVVYCAPYQPCKDQDTRSPWQPPNTDSIMLFKVNGARVDVLSIPRDTNVGPFDPRKGLAAQKINSQYWSGGLDGLSRAAEEVTGERVDYTVVIRVDYAARVIQALGGLDVTVPDIPGYEGKRGIQFDDNAANLHVHLDPGPHHLSGEQAVAYLRMRKGFGDDYGRIDHQKQAVSQLIARLKDPKRLAAALPVILGGLGNGVQTNADASLIETVVPYASQLKLNFITLPTTTIPGTFNLAADREALAKLWASEDRAGQSPADQGPAGQQAPLVRVQDASGAGVGPRFVEALRLAGYRRVQLQTAPASPEHTQVFTQDEVGPADQLADLLGVSRLQGERFPVGSGEVGVLLGEDARTLYAAMKRLPEAGTPSGTTPPESASGQSQVAQSAGSTR